MKKNSKNEIILRAIVVLTMVGMGFSKVLAFNPGDNISDSSFGLLSPVDGAVISDGTPLLAWDHSADAEYYKVWLNGELARDSVFFGEHSITDHHWYEVDSSLTGGSHTWRVEAFGKNGERIHSSGPFSFAIDLTPPAAFGLSSPMDKASVGNSPPVLKWESSYEPTSGIDHYEVWVDGEHLRDVPAQTTSVTLSDLPETNPSVDPADPELIPEARSVLYYLKSIYGKKTLQGQSGFGDAGTSYQISGKWPAIVGVDLSGWNEKRWSKTYKYNIQQSIDKVIRCWNNGGIPTMQWHFADPLGDMGTYPATKAKYATNKKIDFEKMTTPGTDQYKAFIKNLKNHGDYLQQLADRNIPVLWRPFHEIDGAWFWWGHTYGDDKLASTGSPEQTAELWRIMFDYFVNERGFHNLIWVYSAGVNCNGDVVDDDNKVTPEEINFRGRFYPGENYVDISGIDIYPNARAKWADYSHDNYSRAFSFMEKVTPGKMLALTEGRGTPNPDIMKREGSAWLWTLPWYAGGRWNTPEWIEYSYSHEFIITRDELPDLKDAGTGWHWWSIVAVDKDGNKTRATSTRTFSVSGR
jgi:mannan endo-1,4-beta-mannosidase